MKRKLVIIVIFTACYTLDTVASTNFCPDYDAAGNACDHGCCWKGTSESHCCSWAESVGDVVLALIGIASGLVALTIIVCICCRFFVTRKGSPGQVISLPGQSTSNQQARNEAHVNMIPNAPVMSERRTGRHVVQIVERSSQNISRNSNNQIHFISRNDPHRTNNTPTNIQRVIGTVPSVPEANRTSRYENSGYVPDSRTNSSRGTRNVNTRNLNTLPTVSEDVSNIDMVPQSEPPPSYDSLLPSYDSLFNSKINAS